MSCVRITSHLELTPPRRQASRSPAPLATTDSLSPTGLKVSVSELLYISDRILSDNSSFLASVWSHVICVVLASTLCWFDVARIIYGSCYWTYSYDLRFESSRGSDCDRVTTVRKRKNLSRSLSTIIRALNLVQISDLPASPLRSTSDLIHSLLNKRNWHHVLRKWLWGRVWRWWRLRLWLLIEFRESFRKRQQLLPSILPHNSEISDCAWCYYGYGSRLKSFLFRIANRNWKWSSRPSRSLFPSSWKGALPE